MSDLPDDGPRSIKIAGNADAQVLVAGNSNKITVYQQRRSRNRLSALGAGERAHSKKYNPYLGLDAFTEVEADRFFGREELTNDLWDRFRRLHDRVPGQPPPLRMLPLIGPSGCGKSSLGRAGLLAELARRPMPGLGAARILTFTPGAHPLRALSEVLAWAAAEGEPPLGKVDEFVRVLRLAGPQGCEGLRRIADLLPGIEERRLVVLCDQFEEVYSLCDDKDEQDAFIHNLLAAASDRSARVSVVLTLRSDFLGATQRHSDLNQILAKQGVLVPAMSASELRRAISEPARRAGRPLDDATVELLLSEAEGNESSLPLLQFALAQVWLGLEQGIAAPETLKKLGGVGGALAGEAQRLYDSLDEAGKRIARRSFLGMVRLGEGTRDTRRRVEVKALVAFGEQEELVKDVLRLFAQRGARLVALSAELGGLEQAEVTHEALLEHWGQLREWLAASREDIRFHRRLEEATGHWEAQGRAEGLLWRAPDLDLLERFVARAAGDLTAAEMSFFRASRDFERGEKEAAQRQRERQRQRTRFFQGVTVIFAGLVGVAVALAIWAQRERDEARRNLAGTHLEQGRQALLENRLFEAAVYLSRAYEEGERGPAARFLLARAMKAVDSLQLTLSGHESWVLTAEFSPDGTQILSASHDRTARLWNARTGQLIHVLRGHEKELASAHFSHDGTQVATASHDHSVRIWDTRTGNLLRTIAVPGKYPRAARFSADGLKLITASTDGKLHLFSVAGGGALKTIAPPLSADQGFGRSPIPAWDAAFAPDGSWIASAGLDGVFIWDATSGTLRQKLTGLRGTVRSLAIRADGREVAGASTKVAAMAWDVRTGQQTAEVEGFNVAFTPEAGQLATSAWDRSPIIWNAADKAVHARFTEDGHFDEILSVAVSPDGKQVLSASKDGTIKIWSIDAGIVPPSLTRLEGPVKRVAFSPDGQTLHAQSNGILRSWDVTSGQLKPPAKQFADDEKALLSADGSCLLLVIPEKEKNRVVQKDLNDGHQTTTTIGFSDNDIMDCTFHGGPPRFVSTSEGNTAQISGSESGRVLNTLSGHTAKIYEIVFDRSGTRVLTASWDGTARIWDALSGKLMHTLEGHDGWVLSANFSADGRRVVSGGEDGTVRTWDAAIGKQLLTVDAHLYRVGAVAFSPDGTRLVSASLDSALNLWDAERGGLLFQATLPAEGNGTAFSQDGRWLAAGLDNGMALLWETSLEERPPDKIAARVRCRVPLKLDGDRMVAATPPADCPEDDR